MSCAEQFETKTGADFAVFSEQAKVVWLIDTRKPGRLARKRIKELYDSKPDLMRSYEALWAFGEGA